MRPPSRLFRLLSRETSSGAFIPEIDGVRFVAIFGVIFFHLWGNFQYNISGALPVPASFDLPSRVLGQGDLGVELFFVLSGFILGLPFARQRLLGGRPVSLKQYFTRRLTRLEPPYLLNLLLVFLLLGMSTHSVGVSRLWPNLFASAFYMHNIIFGTSSAINTVAWSLEIEVQFYLLAPLLSLIFAVRPAALRRMLLLGGMIAASLASEFVIRNGVLRLTLVCFIQYFLAGFLLADVYLIDWQQRPRKTIAFDGLALFAVAALFSIRILLPQLGMLPIPWLALLVVMGAFRGAFVNRFFTNPWIYTIGGMCYTLYLYHFQIIGFFGHRFPLFAHSFYLNLLLRFTVVSVLVLAVSSLLFVLLEKPFMRRDWPRLVLQAARRRFRLSPAASVP
jgi:peptidoglycan/LPS O-acetylase OafA/YrhL